MLETTFLESARRFPDRPAIDLGSRTVSYAELADEATAAAGALREIGGSSGLTAVFGQHSAAAYTGVLGALLAGRGYVPLNPRFPLERTAAMLARARCESVVCEDALLPDLGRVLANVPHAPEVVVPDADRPAVATLGDARARGRGDFPAPAGEPPASDPGGLAYLLFTSGSTGVPKGVMVTRRNVRAFVDAMIDRYAVDESDRFSHTFDLTFDLSAFDMFVGWAAGACLCVPPASWAFRPARYVDQAELTVWFSVPSVGVMMRRLGLLKPDRFAALKLVLFCGEPLPETVADAFAHAAPNAVVENLYGPTEATIACTLFRWSPSARSEGGHGVVPIGSPYPGMTALIVDERLHEVSGGESGELLVSGPQVSAGYWDDPERTAASFVVPPGKDTIHYRTGDLVRQPSARGPIEYVGRIDDQVKVNGYRVELGEVEAVARELLGIDEVVAVAWPRTDAGAEGIVLFAREPGLDGDRVRSELSRRLPDYMLPRRVEEVEELPRNPNGKYDRKALVARLEQPGPH